MKLVEFSRTHVQVSSAGKTGQVGQVYRGIRRSSASPRPPCDGTRSASVRPSPRQTPGPPCLYLSGKNPTRKTRASVQGIRIPTMDRSRRPHSLTLVSVAKCRFSRVNKSPFKSPFRWKSGFEPKYLFSIYWTRTDTIGLGGGRGRWGGTAPPCFRATDDSSKNPSQIRPTFKFHSLSSYAEFPYDAKMAAPVKFRKNKNIIQKSDVNDVRD